MNKTKKRYNCNAIQCNTSITVYMPVAVVWVVPQSHLRACVSACLACLAYVCVVVWAYMHSTTRMRVLHLYST